MHKFKIACKKLKNKRKHGEGYIDTVVKIIACVLVGALVISGLVFLTNSSMNSAAIKVSSLFAQDYTYNGGSGGSGGGGSGGGEISSAEALEKLQEDYEDTFKYYSSLSKAVADVNNNSTANEDSEKNSAVVGTYVNETGTRVIVMLKDVSVSEKTSITEDTEINLGGNTLSLTTNAAYLAISSTNCLIDGSLPGSKIEKNIDDGTASPLINDAAANLTIKGGTYNTGGTYYKDGSNTACFGIVAATTAGNVKISDCSISASNTGGGPLCYSYAVQLKNSGTSEISNCNISAELGTGKYSYGIYNYSNLTVNSSNVNTSVENGGSAGIVNGSSGSITINNTDVYSDAPNNDTDSGSAGASIGIQNQGTLTFNSGSVTGTHSGLSSGSASKNYINGGSFVSCAHGGMYFSIGSTGEAYVSNATIECVEPSDFISKFDTSKYTNPAMGGFYVGGSSSSNNSNMSIYMNNCTIKGGTNAFVLRGTSGETGNKIYISNSTIDSGRKIRIDDGNALIIGKGNNFSNTDTTNSSLVTETDMIYTKS